ncbi:MAG: DNA/RNA non-specific endonuclease [Janthinobacterium lividum]
MGDRAVAEQANLDTFSYANAAPQAALFNQGELLWAGLEDYVLEHARTDAQRLTVLTAPVFADDDPLYRGTRIPRPLLEDRRLERR